MGYSGFSTYLLPLAGRRKPSIRELQPIHAYFHTLFRGFCQDRLTGAALAYFRDVMVWHDDALSFEQASDVLDGQPVWRFTWWVYDHQSYEPIEHWLKLFLDRKVRAGAFDWKAQEKKFLVVAPPPPAHDLVLAKPAYYQYITLDRGFYLVHITDENVVGLAAAAGVAREHFTPARDAVIPLQFFTSEEQQLIKAARAADVCTCPICVDLRQELGV